MIVINKSEKTLVFAFGLPGRMETLKPHSKSKDLFMVDHDLLNLVNSFDPDTIALEHSNKSEEEKLNSIDPSGKYKFIKKENPHE